MELPKRKQNRLQEYDYSTAGAYFITICTHERRNILCEIVPSENNVVGAGVLDRPQVRLYPHGVVADKYIRQMDAYYNDLSVEAFVIMPNHIHLLLRISDNGRSGTPAPTKGNSAIARFVSTLKRFCNKEYGENIWQRSYHDHIIRDERDYREIWDYIDDNPRKWAEDRYYTQ